MGESIISGIVRVDYTESILIGFEPAYLFDLLIASVFCGVNRDIGVLYGFTLPLAKTDVLDKLILPSSARSAA